MKKDRPWKIRKNVPLKKIIVSLHEDESLETSRTAIAHRTWNNIQRGLTPDTSFQLQP